MNLHTYTFIEKESLEVNPILQLTSKNRSKMCKSMYVNKKEESISIYNFKNDFNLVFKKFKSPCFYNIL